MTSVAPKSQSLSQIKSKLLNPATTSHFSVYIGLPGKAETPNGDPATFKKYMAENGLSLDQDRLQLMCSEATLPGSSLATTELTGDRSGVTERHAYRRIYQDRIDLTFYCDAEQYMPIRFFESWIKYIMNENAGDFGINKPNYSYRVKFPEAYKGNLEITKFEKNINQTKSVVPLTYKFVNVFPVSISSMPVSYDASSLLKCTVSMNYTRYYIGPGDPNSIKSNNDGVQKPDLDANPEENPAATAVGGNSTRLNDGGATVRSEDRLRGLTPTEIRQGVDRRGTDIRGGNFRRS